MEKYLYILVYCFSLSVGLTNDYPEKKYHNGIRSSGKILGRDDRKHADQSGNRVLCRIFKHGFIGDQSSSFSGVYPLGSGHAYIWEFSPIIAASVIDINGNRIISAHQGILK